MGSSRLRDQSNHMLPASACVASVNSPDVRPVVGVFGKDSELGGDEDHGFDHMGLDETAFGCEGSSERHRLPLSCCAGTRAGT